MNTWRTGLIGYGEVGRLFGAALRPAAAWTGAWDPIFNDPARRADPLAHAAAQGMEACDVRTRHTADLGGHGLEHPGRASAVPKKCARWPRPCVRQASNLHGLGHCPEARLGGRACPRRALSGLAPNPPWQAFADRLVAHRGLAANDDTLDTPS